MKYDVTLKEDGTPVVTDSNGNVIYETSDSSWINCAFYRVVMTLQGDVSFSLEAFEKFMNASDFCSILE